MASIPTDPVQRRLVGHSDYRLDRGGIYVLALVQAIVETDQHVAGASGGIRIALDHDPVAASGNIHAQPVLDHDQVAVIIAE